jgi:hypothetical protein
VEFRDPPASALEFLAAWYSDQCDGEWEHEFGVRLDTLDNPGWYLRVDLIGTAAERRFVERRRFDFGAGGWVIVGSDGRTFEASSDPSSLNFALEEFRRFIEGSI